MTKFFNIFKKPCFWLIFPDFLGKNFFLSKIQLCHAQLHMGFQHCAKIQKKPMIQFQEKAQKDRKTGGRTDRPYCIGPFRLMPGSKNITIRYQLKQATFANTFIRSFIYNKPAFFDSLSLFIKPLNSSVEIFLV